MARTPTTTTSATDTAAHPTLVPGLVRLRTADDPGPAGPRSTRATALHDLVARALEDGSGPAYWLDARNAASTYGLAAALGPTGLDTVRVARAFTAHQHHDLVRRTVRTASDPALLVAPNVATLYRDDDAPDREATALFRTSCRLLDALGRSLAVPVLVTAAPADDDAFAERVAGAASRTITCERTRCGLRLAAGDEETLVYRGPGWWQTTVPYWVDLLGAAEEPTRPGGRTPAPEPREVPG